MAEMTSFLSEEEQMLSEKFIREGVIILDVSNMEGLNRIREFVAESTASFLGKEVRDVTTFLNEVHTFISVEKLNELRISVLESLNNVDWIRPTYFSLVKDTLELIVGNELAMQRRVNLSIQLPGDDSSLLPLHSDVWSGDSPFEVVAWLPLVDCYETKSMYLLPPEPNQELLSQIALFRGRSTEDIFERVKDDLMWINASFGKIVVFNQCLAHGNRVNNESETRWTLNCRFKSVYSPYADKKLGEFFEPITLRAASRIGMAYELPVLNPRDNK